LKHSNTFNSSRKCFKCHGFGHIAFDYPNRKIISLVEEDLEDDVEDQLVDEESKEDLTYVDQGEPLVICRILKSTLHRRRLALEQHLPYQMHL
jgi:hypothetical protein